MRWNFLNHFLAELSAHMCARCLSLLHATAVASCGPVAHCSSWRDFASTRKKHVAWKEHFDFHMLVDPVYWRSRDAGWLFVKRIEISPESIQHQRCPSLRRIDPPLLKDDPRMNSIVSSSFDRMRKMAACSFRAFRAVDAQLFFSGDRWRRNARVLVFLCCVCFASVEGPPLLDKFRSSSTIRSSRELHWHWYTTIFNDFSLAEFYSRIMLFTDFDMLCLLRIMKAR